MPTHPITSFGRSCAAILLAVALASGLAAAGEVADADAARKKPLQRCDQVSDKAEIACLQKARERIVEARAKRESAGGGDAKAKVPPGVPNK